MSGNWVQEGPNTSDYQTDVCFIEVTLLSVLVPCVTCLGYFKYLIFFDLNKIRLNLIKTFVHHAVAKHYKFIFCSIFVNRLSNSGAIARLSMKDISISDNARYKDKSIFFSPGVKLQEGMLVILHN